MAVIAAIAVLMVAGALTFLYLFSTLDTNTVVAVTLGVFFSTLLGCGLFAAAFFSEKSGHDQSVTDATRSERERNKTRLRDSKEKALPDRPRRARFYSH